MTLITDGQSVVGSPTPRNWSRLRRVISGGLALVGAGISAWLPVQADQNPPGCLLNNYSIGVLVDKVDAHVGDTLSYSIDIRNLESDIKPTCLASDITLSLVTPDHRTNVVTLRRTSLVPGQTDFYPNVATYVVRSQDLVPKGSQFIVVGTGVSSAVIHQNDVNENSDNFRDVNTVIVSPCIQIAANCVGGIGETAPITYTGSVTNCGDVKLTGVLVSNSLTGLVLGPFDLLPREVRAFSGGYPASICGVTTAQLSVTARDMASSTDFAPKTVAANTSVACANSYTPGLVLNVNCGPTARPTENLTFSGTVQNTGNITLKNVVVTDNVPAGGTTIFTKATLAPGETATFSGSYVAPAACSSTAIFNAAGATVCDAPVSAAARTLTCPILTVPDVGITRACSATAPQPGSPLLYSGTVVNRGKVGLRNLRVVSAQGGTTPVFTLANLAPGATANFNGSFTAPSGVCSVTDTLTVVADDECGNSSATNSVSGSCLVATAPAIIVTHDCPATAPVAGTSGTASGSVRNSGNITLNDVTVVNGTTVVFGPATLAPNQSSTFTFNFTAPADSCSVTTSVTARGVDACSSAAVNNTSTRVCAVATAPSLAITANCADRGTPVGGNLVVAGTVQNTGNVTLTNVTVSTGTTRVFGPVTLAPGASQNYSATSVVPSGVCSITQAFTAAGNDQCAGRPVTANASTTCQVDTTASIDITASCPTGTLTPGATAQYAGTVKNTGTVALNSVKVVNGETVVFTVASLAPGATANYSAAVTVPADTCSISATFTASASDNCGGRGVTKSASVTCPVTTAPAIAVTHDCPTTTLVPGGTATFAGSVRNSGNVTLNDVVVNNGTVRVFGPAALAPGASANFTAQVTAPADSCSVTTSLSASGTGKCNNQAVTATSTKTCPVLTAPAISLVKNCPAAAGTPGGTLTYTATVSNTGNVTLNEVTVNNGTVRVFGPVTLAPGAAQNFTANVTVPANACSITETWVASGKDKCTSTAVTAQNTTTCPINTTGSIDLTVACPAGTLTPGATANYTGTVRNNGNVGLTNIVVTRGELSVFTVGALAPGATANFTAAVTVPADTCSVSASFTASAADNCGGRGVSKSASVTCPVTTAPAVALAHDCPSTTLTPGATAGFSGTVRNSGNVTLNNVVVNNGTLRLFGPATLAPGASATFSGEVTAPADSCTVTTTLSATGAGQCNNQAVTATSSKTCPVVTSPGIALVKDCPTTAASSGGTLTYSANVRNTGNVTLNNVVVNRGTTRIFGPISLAPGASQNFTANVTVPANSCAVTETWVATGQDKCSNASVSADNTTTCPVVTSAGIDLSLNCPSGAQTPGGRATYSGTIRNTGGVTLTNITVINPADSGTVVFSSPSLAPGATVNFTANVSVPNNVCSVSTTLTASGTDVCGARVVTKSASTTCPVSTAPAIALTHDCPVGGFLPGQASSFAASVRNSGNITLSNVVVTLPGNVRVYGPAVLQPGQTETFTASITVPANQKDCTFKTSLTAGGNDACTGKAVSASSTKTCPVNFLPSVEVTLTCPAGVLNQGAKVSYTGVVRNTGNIALINMHVYSALVGGTVVFDEDFLAPGDSFKFTVPVVVPTNCCSMSQTARVTAVDACGSITVSDTSTATCPVAFKGGLVLTKDCPAGKMIFIGDTLRYTGTLKNSGNITLYDVKVTTVVGASSVTLLGPIVLAPGEVVPYKAAYVVPVDYCDSGVAAQGVTLCGNQTVATSNPSRCAIMTTPMIMVTQECPEVPVTGGGTYRFTGTVLNAGDVTLTNVVVRSARAGTAILVGPITLLPGASAPFTGSYQIHGDCCQIVNTVSATGGDRCNGTAVSNSSSVICPVNTNPALTVTKNCGSGTGFTGTVRNSGDINLTDVIVSLGEGARLVGPLNLAPGETASFSGTSATDAPVVAQGLSVCKVSVTAQATCAGVPVGPVAIRSISVTATSVAIEWTGAKGSRYQVQYGDPAQSEPWKNLGSAVVATEAVVRTMDAAPVQPCRLYRVIAVE